MVGSCFNSRVENRAVPVLPVHSISNWLLGPSKNGAASTYEYLSYNFSTCCTRATTYPPNGYSSVTALHKKNLTVTHPTFNFYIVTEGEMFGIEKSERDRNHTSQPQKKSVFALLR